MCKDCIFWTRNYSNWGLCSCPDMLFSFTPYSQKPFSFDGSLEEWNKHSEPKSKPETQEDYRCDYESSCISKS